MLLIDVSVNKNRETEIAMFEMYVETFWFLEIFQQISGTSASNFPALSEHNRDRPGCGWSSAYVE